MTVLKPIKRFFLHYGKFYFGEKKGMLVECYFDLSKYSFPKGDILHLCFEHFKLNIQNELKVTFIYLDTSKKTNPKGILEYECKSKHTLRKYSVTEMANNNFKIEVIPKIEEKELWKIRFELEKYDDVQFWTVWAP